MRPSFALRLVTARRDRLLNAAPLSVPDLLDFDAWVQTETKQLDRDFGANAARLQDCPFADRLLDAGAWIVGLGAYAASILDYFAHDHMLELWGWVGLALGFVGLVLCATVKQRQIWEREEAEDEAQDLLEREDALSEMKMLLLDHFRRRLSGRST